MLYSSNLNKLLANQKAIHIYLKQLCNVHSSMVLLYAVKEKMQPTVCPRLAFLSLKLWGHKIFLFIAHILLLRKYVFAIYTYVFYNKLCDKYAVRILIEMQWVMFGQLCQVVCLPYMYNSIYIYFEFAEIFSIHRFTIDLYSYCNIYI